MAIPERLEMEGGSRYCRPNHPQSQTWYVDLREGKGSKDTFGGADSPFDSLENARKAIEQSMEELDRDPFGVIMEVRGIPLFAYDLPEPALRRTPRPRKFPDAEDIRQFGLEKRTQQTEIVKDNVPEEFSEADERFKLRERINHIEQLSLQLLEQIRELKQLVPDTMQNDR
jgi:hypothetical protein